MAGTAKVKNGTVADDVTTKAAEEVKVVFDNILDASHKVMEDSKPIFEAQQKLWQDGFATWQKFAQSYNDFALEASQKVMDQSLAARKQWLELAEENMKKVQETVTAEQTMVNDWAETYQAQAKAAADRWAKFNPIVK